MGSEADDEAGRSHVPWVLERVDKVGGATLIW